LDGEYMKKNLLLILRGVGIGFILASLVFFLLRDTFAEKSKESISDGEVIEKARELGMIPLTQLDNVYLSDDEVIEKAKELGMEFIDKDKN